MSTKNPSLVSDHGAVAWPVAGCVDLRLPTHPELRFVAVTDGRRCSVHALDDLIVCGSIRWIIVHPEADEDSGLIGYLHVVGEYRRKGIATALLTAAQAYAERYQLPPPRHSDERTAAGDAWARALGAEPAHHLLSSDHEGSPWPLDDGEEGGER
jgi:GNAT superfamily N-acetyltransferase